MRVTHSKDWQPHLHTARFKENGFIGYDSGGVYDLFLEGFFYEINDLGHRSKFMPSDEDYGVAVGCSHTFGTALQEDEVYHQNLDSPLPVYNLGVGGASNQIAIYNLAHLLLNYKAPSFVLFQLTGKERISAINSTKGFPDGGGIKGISGYRQKRYIKNYGIWSTQVPDQAKMGDVVLELDQVDYFDLRLQTDIKVIESLCRDIPLIFSVHSNFIQMAEQLKSKDGTTKTTAPQYVMQMTKNAPDGFHSCKEDHLRWAKDLSEMI